MQIDSSQLPKQPRERGLWMQRLWPRGGRLDWSQPSRPLSRQPNWQSGTSAPQLEAEGSGPMHTNSSTQGSTVTCMQTSLLDTVPLCWGTRWQLSTTPTSTGYVEPMRNRKDVSHTLESLFRTAGVPKCLRPDGGKELEEGEFKKVATRHGTPIFPMLVVEC